MKNIHEQNGYHLFMKVFPAGLHIYKSICYIIFFVSFLCIFICPFKVAAQNTRFSLNPVRHSSDRTKWNIGYIQGGDYADYQKTLIATVQGLIEFGWIKPFETDKLSKLEAQAIWEILAQTIQSDYLCFVKDAFYTADWSEDRRATLANDLKKRIQKKNDIDLIIAMGTWAGQDMSKLSIPTNTLVMSSSEPVLAGIIKGPNNSGAKNLHAQIDPTLYDRQIRFFHDITKFKRLGVIFEHSETGKSYAGVDTAMRLSKERSFEIVTCSAISDIPDTARCEQEYLNCIEKIAPEIDAIYITLHGGVTGHSIPKIVEKTIHHRLLSFSQAGLDEVDKGILTSLSRINFKKVGLFQAAIIANVFNGAAPGELPQVFEEPLNISLNIDTAQAIGFFPSADMIAAADVLIINGTQRKAKD